MRTKCREWGQDCLALKVNGGLKYVMLDHRDTSTMLVMLKGHSVNWRREFRWQRSISH